MKFNEINNSYNHPETIAVVSPYPKRGEKYSVGITGVASYSKNIVCELSRKALVLTDYETKPESYDEENSFVERCYYKHSLTMWFSLYNTLSQFNHIRTVLVHFDFTMYGSILTSGLILPFLLLLKLTGYNVSVVSHSVILDVSKLSGHLGLTDSIGDRVKVGLYNLIFKLFYFLLGLITQNIIVLEDVLRNRLSTVVARSKIITIPHAIDTKLASVEKESARRQLNIKLNEQVVLLFGFVTWFKGSDFFVDTFKNVTKLLNKPARFIIAGGKSPTLSDNGFYQEYYSNIEKLVSESKKVEITGYVPQEKIKLYFAAADLVVFPYRDFKSASGVMSLTFSYRKPFIVSDKLAEMFDSDEFRGLFKRVGLKKADMIFSFEHTDFLNQTTNVLANGVKPKLVKLSSLMAEQRSFSKTATLYEDALFATTTVLIGSLAIKASQVYGK